MRQNLTLAILPLLLFAGIGSGCGLAARHSAHLIEGPGTDSARSIGARFGVISWNTHKQSDSLFRFDLKTLVDSSKVDLVLLQELSMVASSSEIQASLGNRSWALSSNLFDSMGHQEIGVGTTSAAISMERIALLSDATEPMTPFAKASLITRYHVDRETLTVVNVHGLNFSPRLDGFRRQIAKIQAELGNRGPGPMIIAGDFNTWSAAKTSLLDSMLAISGLVRVDFGNQERLKKRAFGHSLDHIYYTPAFLVVDSASRKVHDKIRSSDHVPIEVWFEFRHSGS